MQHLRDFFDFGTCKVLAIWLLGITISAATTETWIHLLTAIGACFYIWLKLYRRYKRSD